MPILGPILPFLAVPVNNSDPNSKFLKFADDTTTLTTGKYIEEATAKMNNAISKVRDWFLMNKVNLNPSKTSYMVFNHKTDKTDHLTIDNSQIMRVWDKGTEKSFKLVEIHIDERLKWGEHKTYIKKKVSSATYGLTSSSKELDTHNKNYHAVV